MICRQPRASAIHPAIRERSPLICQVRRAQISAGPSIWNLPPAVIEETECQAQGGDRCVYHVAWLEPSRWWRSVFGGLVRMARTPDQLVDQASLLLHAPLDSLSAPAKASLSQSRHVDAVLTGRKVLVIDDDIRNIFSLASALEEYGIERLQPGDVIVANDPYRNGTHVNDLLFVRPVFHAGTLAGFAHDVPMLDAR